MHREDIKPLDELDHLADEVERRAVRIWLEVRVEGQPENSRRIIKFEEAPAA